MEPDDPQRVSAPFAVGAGTASMRTWHEVPVHTMQFDLG